MKSEEVFKKALELVMNVTGVPELAILHSSRKRCSDARYILVIALSRMMSDTEIGEYLHRTSQGVGFIRRNGKRSEDLLIRNNLKEVCKRIESGFFPC